MQDSRWLVVPCPNQRCRAGARQGCRTRYGTLATETHVDRIAAAQRQEAERLQVLTRQLMRAGTIR